MSIRYLSNIAIGAAGAFLVVATQAFSPSTIGWLAFSMGVVAVIVAAAELATVKDTVQRVTAASAAGIGLLAVVLSRVFAEDVVSALALAGGLALVAIALIGLTAHELRAERVVHELTLGDDVEAQRLAASMR